MKLPQIDISREATPLWLILAQGVDALEQDGGLAERHARLALELAPGQPQALQLLTSALRAQGNESEAVATLEDMASRYPGLASIHAELGTLLAELGEDRRAQLSLQRAVELEPQHAAAWRPLGDVLARTEDFDGAARAFKRHFSSSIMDLKTLEQVTALDLEKMEFAEGMLREYLGIHPTDLTALMMLGAINARLGQFENAEEAYSRALELDPFFDVARVEKLSALRQQMKFDEECREAEILIEHDPEDRSYRYLMATALSGAGRHAEALEYCERLLEEDPEQSRLWTSYGYCLRVIGRQAECVAAFKNAIKFDPGLGEAWWGLANLKTFRFEPADIDVMRNALMREDMAQQHPEFLHFALGKALEDAREYNDSFEHYHEGNALIRARRPYDSSKMTAEFKREQEQYTAEFFARHAGKGCPSPEPIFILGMPRSGSTLVEQILASHTSVEGAGELSSLIAVIRELRAKHSGDANVGTSDLLDKEDLGSVGQQYLERCLPHRKLMRPFFTDKMPTNFRHLGAIHTILPNAKIIDVRRHPLACCFSNFKQIFPSDMGPSYDLADMGCYYRDYVELMAHFDRVLPGRVHRVIYEDMIADPEGEIRRLLDYCGLQFEDQCLRFYENDRGVRTISSEQVRRPVYRDSLEQWRHFEPWLDPLKVALGPVLTAYPAVPEEF